MASNRTQKYRTPNRILPGRPLDIQQGGDDPATRYIFDLLRELGQNTAQIGTIIEPAGGFSSDDVLVFDGAQWRAVDKAALLALNDLTDTVISAPATNHILRFNGVSWVNVSSIDLLALTDLSDVTISVPLTGHVLRYSGSAWVNVQLAELLALTDLSDVTITSPATAQVPRYNGSLWVNAALSADDLGNESSLVRTTMPDGRNIALGTTTGSKVGTGATQKLGLWGHAPAVQPAAYTVSNVTPDRVFDPTATTLNEVAQILGTLISDLQGFGAVG